jgi:hypothetical protein
MRYSHDARKMRAKWGVLSIWPSVGMFHLRHYLKDLNFLFLRCKLLVAITSEF